MTVCHDETAEFLASTMSHYDDVEAALHNGDASGRMAMWSRTEPLTLFGAAVSARGWAEIGPTFEWLGSSFADCESYRNEVIAAEASGDRAYIVALEHTTVHGDATSSESGAELVARLRSADAERSAR